ncbi:PD-(D/E)XK nuclease family protein [Nocardia sp. CDC153]|uniref:RecB family exonuclease n=1 Tax=Nocardia sp. CDC153 TaxID=3112167 RepID=UPI002DBF1C3C|nr:PD-(D/E)XK nuclease family protein [Nocardia sp. CDC153]MEC3956107.1 PD-(D/E)XK nuclease family protein [Nocardia sp. CDC153]
MSVDVISTPETERFAPRGPALSPSRAIDFKQCPLKYRLRVIDQIPEPPSLAAVRGTVVHAVLEALFGLPAAERDVEAALALVEPAWAGVRESRPEVGGLVPDEALEGFLAEVRKLVGVYFRLEDPTGFDPESCETFIEAELPDGTPLRGIVDRLDRSAAGELTVVDYKTGRAPGLAYETKALFQLKFYALVLLRTQGRAPAELRLMYLADGVTLTYRPDPEELFRFERILSALWAAIVTAAETGEFPPSPGWMCQYCDFKRLCPEFGGTPPPFPSGEDEPRPEPALLPED